MTTSRADTRTPVGTPVSRIVLVGVDEASGIPNTLAPDASPRFQAVAERLLAAMADHKVPGAALGIYADGLEEHATFGVASVARQSPVIDETLFQLGPLTTTYTATAVMRLVDRGVLALDASVRRYLPELTLADAGVAAKMTVRHLLTHTSGLCGADFRDTGSGDEAIARYVATRLPTLPQLSPPGAFFSYSTTGFILLGRLIEVVTGRPYRQAMHTLVLGPLGLSRSTFSPEEALQHPYADGYFTGEVGGQDGVAVQRPLFLPRNSDPAGGLWSTTRDQLRYVRFHLGNGAANGACLLGPWTPQEMQTPHVAIPGEPALAMGLGWFIRERAGLRLITHAGDTFGQHVEFALAPEGHFAFVLLTNAEPGGANAARGVLAEALGRYLGLDPDAGTSPWPPAASPAPAGPALPVSPDQLAQYAGRYSLPTEEFVLRLGHDALVLSHEWVTRPDQTREHFRPDLPRDVPVTFVAEDLASVELAGVRQPLSFVRAPNGTIGWLGWDLRLVPRTGPA
jgi:CubicO group peptidase (beta-lactamase class C family)